ncbi:uncharacterized protein Z519_03398 [Cladophialophora bantiana CBS 173.52]|uniref:Uncharacterized protein n=1 Tax=Cladophialophora bantiana (strain ATCC 10958 / CBS 173.52 / CDC B-1940 / NIH 8579) TaxID=1442370 RepID=A0A0D2IHW3_CLAB1|nr:uncharacterized protein Z519_03398 [Cladophialophora bantiana CBS 173.52]KIW96329.1 hypothetical protein Z519_03398 [Cladophialophora bantiana CBS 173.52]
MEDLLERCRNPPPTIGPKKYPGKPLLDQYANAEECDEMLWDWKLRGVAHETLHKQWERLTRETIDRGNLIARFVELKEHFAVTGDLEFPPSWLERWPGDMKYKIISD